MRKITKKIIYEISESDLGELIEKYKGQYGLEKLAKEYGVGHKVIRDILVKNNIPIKRKYGQRGMREETKILYAKYKKLKDSGLSYQKIAKQCFTSTMSVYRIIKAGPPPTERIIK